MAVTKIKSIKATVKKAIDYITDEKKTDGALLVSSFGCEPKSAHLEFKMTEEFAKVAKDKDYTKQSKNLAYHMIQSFSTKDDVTPEKAHEIGMQLAEQLTKGKYQFVVSTHVDKGHVHNHIIFNATSFEDFKKFNCNKFVFKEIRQISDKLCAENELSVIDADKSKSKGMGHKEWSEVKKGTSWKAKLKNVMDEAIKGANSYEDFLATMKAAGYEMKEGKHIAFRATGDGQQRFTRAKTLGVDYTEEMIRKRIENKDLVQQVSNEQSVKPDKPKISLFKRLIGHISNARRIKLSLPKQLSYYARRQKIKDVKELADMLLVLRQENILNRTGLENKISEMKSKSHELRHSIIAINEKVMSFNEVAKYVHTLEQHKPMYEKYQKAFIKRAFRAKHENEIATYEFAEQKLKELQVDPSVTVDRIQELVNGFNVEIREQNNQLQELNKQVKEFERIDKRINELMKEGKDQKKKELDKHKKKQQER